MSEQINKVLASTAQSFTTAQQAQARANIDAQQSIAWSYDTASAITAINGSAVGGGGGGMTGVSTDSNMSGNGTSGSPLGLNSSIAISSTYGSTTFGLQNNWGMLLPNVQLQETSNNYTQMHAGKLTLSGAAGNATSFYTSTNTCAWHCIEAFDSSSAVWEIDNPRVEWPDNRTMSLQPTAFSFQNRSGSLNNRIYGTVGSTVLFVVSGPSGSFQVQANDGVTHAAVYHKANTARTLVWPHYTHISADYARCELDKSSLKFYSSTAAGTSGPWTARTIDYNTIAMLSSLSAWATAQGWTPPAP